MRLNSFSRAAFSLLQLLAQVKGFNFNFPWDSPQKENKYCPDLSRETKYSKNVNFEPVNLKM